MPRQIQPVEEIAPKWSQLMAPAKGQIYKVNLPPRHGKSRSLALEIESNSRSFRLRARDHSRARPVVARSLDIQCPIEITSKEEALKYLQKFPEKFLLFQGVLEEMENGYWMGELNVSHKERKHIHRNYPHGTLGHCLRWYMSEEIGSDNQRDTFGADAYTLLRMESKNGEFFGHINAEDLDEDIADQMHFEWIKAGRAYTTLRGAFALLSVALSRGAKFPKSTGVRRGKYWGSVDSEGRGNPINNERRRVDSIIADNRLKDENSRPQPFTQEECTALTKVFLRQEHLKPYFPLFALLLSTGSRPNEVLALRWSHVIGLWKGHQIGTHVPPAQKFVLDGQPVFFEFGVENRERLHVDPEQRFKCVKNGCEHQPLLNTYVPEFEDLFAKAIKAALPPVLDCMTNREWRKNLVFQGPKAGDDFRLPFDWHNFRRYFMQACAYAGVRYRRPYNLRHTYVSLMVHHGQYSCKQVATWIGDTESTTRSNYLGVVNFPLMDKVEGKPDLNTMINAMSVAEKAQLMAQLASSISG